MKRRTLYIFVVEAQLDGLVIKVNLHGGALGHGLPSVGVIEGLVHFNHLAIHGLAEWAGITGSIPDLGNGHITILP